MRRWTAFQDSVMRRLSSMLLIMAANLVIGMAKLSVEPGTKVLEETSNIPRNGPRVVCGYNFRLGYLFPS